MKLNRQRLKNLLILLALGLGYYIETQTLGWTLKCPLYALTGLQCPACGITRACVALLHGDFAAAAAANRGLTLALPVLLPWLAVFLYRWLWGRDPMTRGMKAVGLLLAAWACLWAVLRNLPVLL